MTQFLFGALLASSGCGGGPAAPSPSQDVARAELTAWRAQPYKTCSLDDVFPSIPPRAGERPPGTTPPPPKGWDPAALRATYGENLVLRAEEEPDRWAILTGFQHGSEGSVTTSQTRSHRVDDVTLVAKLSFEDGRCRVELDGETLADLPLYGTARLGASMTPARTQTSGFDAKEIDLTQRAAGEPEDSWFAIPRVAPQHHFIDLAGLPLAVNEALLPSSGAESTRHHENVARILDLDPALLEGALAKETILYGDLFIADAPLPDLVTKASWGSTYRAPYVLSDAELASLDAATSLRFEWVYAREEASSSVRFEIVADRRAGSARAFDLASVRLLAEVASRGDEAATCIADAVERARTTLATDVPRGAAPGTGDAVEACADLGRPFVTQLASDQAASQRVLALVTDATRAVYAHTEAGRVTPSDGGAAYTTSFAAGALVPLFAELAQTDAGLARLEALDSRITRGFAASARALRAKPFDAPVARALLEASADRAFEAARARFDTDEDYAPLDADDVLGIAAVLGSGPAPEDFVREVTSMIRNGEPFAGDAAIACARSGALDTLRAQLVSLETTVADAHETWVRNVFLALMRWGTQTSAISPSDATYCDATFLGWAAQNAEASALPCTYMGATFDTNTYCE